VRLKGLGKLKKKSNELIRTRTRGLPACSIVPQRTTLPVPDERLKGEKMGSGRGIIWVFSRRPEETMKDLGKKCPGGESKS
jgi:hypothetical protein